MTRFATGDLAFPAAEGRQCRVRCMRVGFELILVTGLAGFTADVIAGRGFVVLAGSTNRLRTARRNQPHDHGQRRSRNEQWFDNPGDSHFEPPYQVKRVLLCIDGPALDTSPAKVLWAMLIWVVLHVLACEAFVGS